MGVVVVNKPQRIRVVRVNKPQRIRVVRVNKPQCIRIVPRPSRLHHLQQGVDLARPGVAAHGRGAAQAAAGGFVAVAPLGGSFTPSCVDAGLGECAFANSFPMCSPP